MQNNKNLNNHVIILPTWLLLALFVAPLVIALVIYINWSIMYYSKHNSYKVDTPCYLHLSSYFDLSNKIVTADLSQSKEWKIVYFTPKVCNQRCEQQKIKLAHMYNKLGNKQEKVRVITTNSFSAKVFNAKKYQDLILRAGNMLIADPNDQVMKYYAGNLSMSSILEDLLEFVDS